MIPEEVGYRSFLLRMWCSMQNHQVTWRASLEDPRTGQQHFFTSKEALDEFLRILGEQLENELEIKDR
jgi:hypothetical protein